MIKEVYPNIYQCEVPLKGSPLKTLNSYVIRSEDRSLIIDTGFNTKECKEVFMENLNEINVDIKKSDLLITHLHSDHAGLAPYFNKKGVKVYIGERDGKLMNAMTNESYYKRLEKYSRILDMEKYAKNFFDNPDNKYNSEDWVDFQFLKEGEVIKIGEYCFKVVDIPGHTIGHIGLYEKTHKIFFGGDHILERITPNVIFSGFKQDILNVYFNSLNKIYEYDVDYLFSSHRALVKDYRKRIEELYQHHKERLDEAISIMEDGRSTVGEVAQSMQWNFMKSKWNEFPQTQKVFATLEAMSHLEHLVFTNKAKKYDKDGVLHYKLI